MRSKTKEYRAAYWQKWRQERSPVIVRGCAKCHATFTPKGTQKLCKKCKEATCYQCQVSFVPKDGKKTQKFCSRKCKDDALRGSEPVALAANRGRKPRTYAARRNKHGSVEDREWRAAVFKRDDFTCQICKSRGGRLQADHIKPFSTHPELRHDLNNGRTLCVGCHKQTDTYGWKGYWLKVRAAKRMAQEVLAL